jgi:hypothetical protein
MLSAIGKSTSPLFAPCWLARELNLIGKPVNNARYLTNDAIKSFGYSFAQPAIPSRLRHSVSSSPVTRAGGLQPRRYKFSMISKDELKKLESENEALELVGFHGTTRWAIENIEAVGIDLGLTGKYLGGRSAGGSGLYTVDKPEIADHYARRAALGEPHAFDLDTRRQIIAVYRLPSDKLKTATMPEDILGKPQYVKEFREANPAHQYHLEGKTPVPRRLSAAGIKGKTTLISDEGLTSEDVEYVAVTIEFEPKQG